VEFGSRVRFRHPLVRSAVYRSASFPERQRLHAALAQVTDPETDPDRRAWHRAAATAGPDEDVAAELERAAGRARARGGLAAAATFLKRAVLLTADLARQAERALAAAEASFQAGAFDSAFDLLAAAEAGATDELVSARADMLRGQVTFASGMGRDASHLLLTAAKRLEPLDLDLARETYLNAWIAALFAGRLAHSGDLLEVSRAARSLPVAAEPRTVDLALDGLSLIMTDGHEVDVPDVLLLDEPLSALDPLLRKQVRAELKDLQRAVGITFVFVTHDQEEALALSDQIAVMHAGAVQQIGTPQELYRRPATRFVADFLGTMNWIRCGDSGKEVGLRPEAIQLSHEPNSVPATIERTTYLGSFQHLDLRLSTGEAIVVQLPADVPYNVHGAVFVHWNPADEVHL